MNKKDFESFIKQVQKDIKATNNIEKLAALYNGYNYTGELFDFEYDYYIFTISTDSKGNLYIANDVDVYHKKHDYFMGNYDIKNRLERILNNEK